MELPNNEVLKINYKLYMILIDGKILNILTDTKSSQACPIAEQPLKNLLTEKKLGPNNLNQSRKLYNTE